jgi:uncharacterized protein (DUF2132 family)
VDSDPLHGVTLKVIVEALVDRHGWAALGERVPIRCFLYEPSLTSSLRFLRKTPWARAQVEQLYVADLQHAARNRERNRRRAARRAHREEHATDGPAPERDEPDDAN